MSCSCEIFLLEEDLEVPLRVPKLIIERESIGVYFKGRLLK
jgi:hypothetical protein